MPQLWKEDESTKQTQMRLLHEERNRFLILAQQIVLVTIRTIRIILLACLHVDYVVLLSGAIDNRFLLVL